MNDITCYCGNPACFLKLPASLDYISQRYNYKTKRITLPFSRSPRDLKTDSTNLPEDLID